MWQTFHIDILLKSGTFNSTTVNMLVYAHYTDYHVDLVLDIHTRPHCKPFVFGTLANYSNFFFLFFSSASALREQHI